MNYIITSSEGESAQSFTFEVALEKATGMVRGTNKVATIISKEDRYSASYKWCFEDDYLIIA